MKELNERIARYQSEAKAIREVMLQALKQNDEEMRQELQYELHKIYESMNKMRMDSDGIATSYHEEKWRMGEAVKQAQEEANQERELAEAEYRRRMGDLSRRVQGRTNLAALLSGRHCNSNSPEQTGSTS